MEQENRENIQKVEEKKLDEMNGGDFEIGRIRLKKKCFKCGKTYYQDEVHECLASSN